MNEICPHEYVPAHCTIVILYFEVGLSHLLEITNSYLWFIMGVAVCMKGKKPQSIELVSNIDGQHLHLVRVLQR